MGNSSQKIGFSISTLFAYLQYLNLQNLDSNDSDKACRLISAIRLMHPSDLSLRTQLTACFNRFTLYSWVEFRWCVLLRYVYSSQVIISLTAHPSRPFYWPTLFLLFLPLLISFHLYYMFKHGSLYCTLQAKYIYIYLCIMYAKTYLSMHKKIIKRERRE